MNFHKRHVLIDKLLLSKKKFAIAPYNFSGSAFGAELLWAAVSSPLLLPEKLRIRCSEPGLGFESLWREALC